MKPHKLAIVRRLIEAGIIPQECTKFSLTVKYDEPIRIASECFVTEEQMRVIVDALIENPEEARRIAHTTILKALPSGKTQSIDLASKGTPNEI
jgi:hypothetical protein